MKKIAIIVCCYNQKNDTINCINSIFKSSVNNFDIYIIDNGSSDGTSDEIMRLFGDTVSLVRNHQNLGVGAGFNTGIKIAMEKGYSYLMTVDHDVIFDQDTVKILYGFLEQHPDVGAAGSKFCYMDRPHIIQMFGGNMKPPYPKTYCEYRNKVDNEQIPEVYYCDHVILGACMMRTDAVLKAGMLEESFFIYAEDIEWCLRLKNFGYRSVICAKSKVLHRYGLSVSSKKNTFGTYYFRRNLFRAVAMYMPEDMLHDYCEHVLYDLFQGLYSCNYQKKYNMMTTLMYSLDDALNNKFGIAEAGRIFELDQIENRLQSLVQTAENICLLCRDDMENKLIKIRIIIQEIKRFNDNANISLCSDDNELLLQFPDISTANDSVIKDGLLLRVCEHIYSVKHFEKDGVYVDSYFNVVMTESDREYCLQFESQYSFFKHAFFPIMYDKVKKLRNI